QSGRNVQPARSLDDRQESGWAAQVLLIGGNEEGETPRQRKEERREPQRVTAAASGPAGKRDDGQQDRGHGSEEDVSTENPANGGQERVGGRRETGEIRTHDPLERSVLGGGQKGGQVQGDESRQQKR